MIDTENSVDKRKFATNQFGYKSLHYVVSMSKDRCHLTEYKNYEGVKFEIQIRSILQHAWAEIEHDLGYKSAIEIPDSLKRNFSRLSALLEIADIEFDKLKKELVSYEDMVPNLIQNSPKEVEINKASLESVRQTNRILIDARQKILTIGETSEVFETDYDGFISAFKYLGIATILELEKALNNEKEKYLKFVTELCKRNKNRFSDGVGEGIEILYLQHYLVAKTKNSEKVVNYFRAGNMSGGSVEADAYIDVYNSLED